MEPLPRVWPRAVPSVAGALEWRLRKESESRWRSVRVEGLGDRLLAGELVGRWFLAGLVMSGGVAVRWSQEFIDEGRVGMACGPWAKDAISGAKVISKP
jgi:hypothetical protein